MLCRFNGNCIIDRYVIEMFNRVYAVMCFCMCVYDVLGLSCTNNATNEWCRDGQFLKNLSTFCKVQVDCRIDCKSLDSVIHHAVSQSQSLSLFVLRRYDPSLSSNGR